MCFLQVPIQRVAGFIKRLCTVSLQSQANGALAFLSYVKSFLQVTQVTEVFYSLSSVIVRVSVVLKRTVSDRD